MEALVAAALTARILVSAGPGLLLNGGMTRNLPCASWLVTALALLLGTGSAGAADRPQWGEAWSRNMVSPERGLPAEFDPATGKGVKWTAELGTETHSSPVIAGGRVFIGTNNGHPRDPTQVDDRGVLMCFDERTGRFLWQIAVPKRTEDRFFDWPQSGIASPATVEHGRVYVVNNRGEVVCLEARDGREVWKFDLTTGAGIWSHDAAHSSILVRGNLLYLNSGTGVDNTHKRIRTPDAPSLVVLDKRTGRFLARDNEHIAPNIFHCTWSAPSLGRVDGRPLVFFGGGNGILYAFELLKKIPPPAKTPASFPLASAAPAGEPASAAEIAFLQKAWQFDFDPAAPKTNVHRFNSNRRESPSDFFGMPVFHQDRIYLAGGGDIWWGKNEAWLKCVAATGRGGATADALRWSYPLVKHVMATPAVDHGLVFIGDCGPRLHCVDAETGQPCWTQELKGEAWASCLVADGKVYLGTRAGIFYVFAASREKRLLCTVELGSPVSATAAAANGVLYLATMNRLYALR
jgi:outer membrane protein assembly factor BamB